MTKEDYEFWDEANRALIDASHAEEKRNAEQISAALDRTGYIDDPIADFDDRQDELDAIEKANRIEFRRIWRHWMRLAQKRGNAKIIKDLARWDLK